MSLLTKQRTREHIIADLSVNHAEKMFLLAGHAINRVVSDYGYDLFVITFDDSGHVEADLICVQLKASDSPEYSQNGDYVTVRVDQRDDSLWSLEENPVVLIVYDATKDVAYFVHYQTLPRTTRRSVRIPTTSRLDANAARQLRDAKNAARKGNP